MAAIKDIVLSAFQEKYTVDKIKSANINELSKTIDEMLYYKKEHQLTQSYLQDRKNKSNELLFAFNEGDENNLKRENEILSYLDFMLKIAWHEQEKYLVPMLKESMKSSTERLNKIYKKLKNHNKSDKDTTKKRPSSIKDGLIN